MAATAIGVQMHVYGITRSRAGNADEDTEIHATWHDVAYMAGLEHSCSVTRSPKSKMSWQKSSDSEAVYLGQRQRHCHSHWQRQSQNQRQWQGQRQRQRQWQWQKEKQSQYRRQRPPKMEQKFTLLFHATLHRRRHKVCNTK